MPDLFIDLAGSRQLAATIFGWSRQASQVADGVAAACNRAGIDSPSIGQLHALSDCLADVARVLHEAQRAAGEFLLPPIEQLSLDLRWNEVRQVASHNTYRHPMGVVGAHERGFRAFELDLHLGRPTSLAPAAERPNWLTLPGLVHDAFTHDDVQAGDWYVYHDTLDPESAHETLGEALDQVTSLAVDVAPITLFLDLKDPLGGAHSAEQLDRLLRERLGDRLFSPSELLARAPEVDTLAAAVLQAGWPSVGELRGRVLVVVTDETDGYRTQSVERAAAFVAAAPSASSFGAPDVVFFNERGDRLSRVELDAIETRSAIVRSWGPPIGPGLDANYVAID